MYNFLTTNWTLIQQAMNLFVLGCGLFGLSVLVSMIRGSYVRTR